MLPQLPGDSPPAPQLDLLPSSDRPLGQSSKSFGLGCCRRAKGLRFVFAPCEGVCCSVGGEEQHGLWDAVAMSLPGPSAIARAAHLAQALRVVLAASVDKLHAVVVKYAHLKIYIYIYLLLTTSRSHLLHHMQGKHLLHKGMRDSVARD